MLKHRLFSALACAVLATAAVPAHASLISLQTRFTSDGPAPSGTVLAQGQYYRDKLNALTVAAPTAGYCNTSLSLLSGVSNQSACHGGAQNIGFSYLIDFGLTAGQAANFSIQIGPDFGRGGAVYLDNTLLAVSTDDLWWAGNYGATNEIFSVSSLGLAAGNHRLSIYGLEGCCDGTQSARFQVANGAWTTFATNDGLSAPQRVPEPAMPALLLAALAAATWGTRRARIKSLAVAAAN